MIWNLAALVGMRDPVFVVDVATGMIVDASLADLARFITRCCLFLKRSRGHNRASERLRNLRLRCTERYCSRTMSPPVQLPPPSRETTILAVEDQDPLRQAVSRLLRSTGLSVIAGK